MLDSIVTIQSRDFEATLTASDRGIKYYGAHDLPNYFQLMPVYFAEMLEVKKTDFVTWNCLKQDFVEVVEAWCTARHSPGKRHVQ